METLSYQDLKRARQAERDKAWREGNKDKILEKHRRYREKNRDRIRAGSRTRRVAGADHEKRYGLSLAQWRDLLASQGNACAACKSPDPGAQPWHTDHDHKTGLVRGILCFRCNIALGMIGDDYESVILMMRNFASYLSPKHSG